MTVVTVIAYFLLTLEYQRDDGRFLWQELGVVVA